MNVFAKFDGIPLMILEVIKETKRYRHKVGRSDGRTTCKQYTLPQTQFAGVLLSCRSDASATINRIVASIQGLYYSRNIDTPKPKEN